MKRTSTNSKTSLFLMEMIFALFFLVLSSTACIHIFIAAKANHIQAQEWHHMQLLTTSVGEILEGSDGNVQNFLTLLPDGNIQDNVLTWYYDSSWVSASTSQADYEMDFKLIQADFVKQGTLSFYRCSDHTQIYTIDLCFPCTAASDKEAIS